MKKILATISEGQLSSRQIKSLESYLHHNYRSHVGHEKVMIIWNQVPPKNIYHDYRNGQPSILLIECDKGLDQHQRVKMFEACTQDWLAITGQTINQLIISVLETPEFNALLNRNSKYLTLIGKAKYFSRLIPSLLTSKRSKGYYTFRSSF